MMAYARWFQDSTGEVPHPWQAALGAESQPTNRLIRIPTGLGKTLGVLLPWIYHRVHRRDGSWPRRLAWCLPMRVLVEQTHAEAERVLQRLGLLWDGAGPREGKVGLHLAMGGVDAGDWHLYPEEPAILVGTQDMMLSRALNRGYGAARARWPIDFGLLSQDCLWVMDEVQLMDVGLATSAQLQAFRDAAGGGRGRAHTWWMSATLQPAWLESRDTEALLARAPRSSVPPVDRKGRLWDDVAKACAVESALAPPSLLAAEVAMEHAKARGRAVGPTLVVVNTVDRAVEVACLLRKDKQLGMGTDVRLVHSRFRGFERRGWRAAFLNREACAPGTDRIIVATQVVEAGVDISASLLFTDLAPWPSLVQRFGRAARWGGEARVVVIDTAPKDDKAALPYSKAELDAARGALVQLSDVAPRSLEAFEEGLQEAELARLYPFEAEHLVLRHEVDELFDTSADLSGADVDVSRFIRSGEERDLQVFWANLPDTGLPDASSRPSRDALCSVPFLRARAWLCGKGSRLLERRTAFVWDWLNGAWREAEARDLYPGQTVLVDASHGGYDWDEALGFGLGWNPREDKPVSLVAPPSALPDDRADAAQDDESLSESPYRTIATHGAETGALAARLANGVEPALAPLFELAGWLHDVGKAHPAFQGSMRADDRPDRQDLAKAPERAWKRTFLYLPVHGHRRPGFRHELASALAIFGILARHRPEHAALLGPWRELLAALGERPELQLAAHGVLPSPIEAAVLALDGPGFDLCAYLVASHHGKVRMSFQAAPSDQDAAAATGRLTIRGVEQGDVLPAVAAPPAGHDELPATPLDLSLSSMGISARTGAAWTDRVLALLAAHGPFRLAWLEALLRAADVRASRIATPDPLLVEEAS
ncbi:MAG: DEAD/DEAH box helicase [Polyangiaceae bacterium]|nr:DEAD/DEAH box helicase [Polyangiaceae bacterium]